MCKDNILNKIKNLLNKTVENGCTESEAMNALAKARQLMLKHKIEEKDLKIDDKSNIIRHEITEFNINVPWLYRLVNCFATNFGVLTYVIKYSSKNSHYVLFGLEEDVNCIKELIMCAKNFGEEKANKYCKEYREIFGTAKGCRNSWLNGFVSGIEAKYEEQNKREDFGLMIIVDKDVENLYNNVTTNFNKTERTIKIEQSDATAKYCGFIEGKKFGTTELPE